MKKLTVVQKTQKLDNSQQIALKNICELKNEINVLAGGPGRGKTFLIKKILKAILNNPTNSIDLEDIYFATPTGKAAKVLNDALTDDIVMLPNAPMTIHRLLGCMGKQWVYSPSNKLPAKLIIVDESSMVDSKLMARLISSVSENCFFILVGDDEQLQPVAPGSPFLDIIALNHKDCVNRLTINHRAAEGGLIAYATDKINQGEMPLWGTQGGHSLQGEREDDLFLHKIEDKTDALPLIKKICKPWYEGKEDFMVLAPQHTGVCGITQLNKDLQSYLNPITSKKPYLKVAQWLTFNEGDRVINTKNNYGLNIFNGFVGTILKIEFSSFTGKLSGMIVDFEGKPVAITKMQDVRNLQLAYCISIHKSQGSEYKKGIVVFHSSHYYMLSRSLLYVAVSRFKEELHVIGDMKGLRRGLKNNVKGSRNTYLKGLKEKG